MTKFDPYSETLSPNLQRMVDEGCGPMTVVDQRGYQSPVTKEWVEGRKADRDHMKRHDIRRVEPSEKSGFGI